MGHPYARLILKATLLLPFLVVEIVGEFLELFGGLAQSLGGFAANRRNQLSVDKADELLGFLFHPTGGFTEGTADLGAEVLHRGGGAFGLSLRFGPGGRFLFCWHASLFLLVLKQGDYGVDSGQGQRSGNTHRQHPPATLIFLLRCNTVCAEQLLTP